MSDSPGIDLIKAVEQKIEKVRTKSLDLSFNELLDMFENDELIIDPDYQRLFRWSEGSQSRLIESLILEMPLPPIFLIEISDGRYELIDGLQRISSYLHFRGKHPQRKKDDGTFRFLKLSDCDIVSELNGLTYDDLPKALEIKLKRNFIRVEILRKESDRRLRYYMFKRLNTGEDLEEQEIRNCTIRLLDNTFNKFLVELSENQDFLKCISNVGSEKIEKKYDEELILRYFAYKNNRDEYVHDVSDFLTDYMETVSDPENTEVVFDYDQERKNFERTFNVFSKTLGDKIFSAANSAGNLISRFLVYHFEAFCIGIQPFLDKIDENDATQMELLKHLFEEIKKDEEFKKITTGGGKNYSGPLNQRIGFVTKKLGEVL